ncbi:MAG: sulfatase [Verrucomicrobiales bacterium]
MKLGFIVVSFLLFPIGLPALTESEAHERMEKAREAADRPNVILIFLDDSGYGDYSHNGNPVIETPVISRLAHEGASFTQFYVPASACSASRYSLLTGRYPGHSGFGSWVLNPDSRAHILENETTLAEGFKSRGYETAMLGKWHLGNPNPSNGMTPASYPLAHGFDSWLGTNVSHDYDVAKLLRSDETGSTPIPGYREIAANLPSNLEVSTSLTGLYTQAAEEFIRSNKDKPFFLYVAHNQPHLALHVDKKFEGRSKRGLLGDVMAEIDDSVGRIMRAVKESGIASNTILVFSSDNGPWVRFLDLAENPKYGDARLNVGYAQPFRDGKGSNWEGGHRVPGIFHWPGMIPPGRRLEPACTLDVLPTLFAIAGTDGNLSAHADGRDIGPLLMPRPVQKPVPPFEMAYSGPDTKPNAIRVENWKLHIKTITQTKDTYGSTASRETPLLYQVEHDLGERIDRAAEHPEVVARLLERLRIMEASLQKD